MKNTDEKKCSFYQIFVDDFQLTEIKKNCDACGSILRNWITPFFSRPRMTTDIDPIPVRRGAFQNGFLHWPFPNNAKLFREHTMAAARNRLLGLYYTRQCELFAINVPHEYSRAGTCAAKFARVHAGEVGSTDYQLFFNKSLVREGGYVLRCEVNHI